MEDIQYNRLERSNTALVYDSFFYQGVRPTREVRERLSSLFGQNEIEAGEVGHQDQTPTSIHHPFVRKKAEKSKLQLDASSSGIEPPD